MTKSVDTVFLLGAGASAQLGLPTTKGFLSDFELSNNQLTELLNVIMKYLKVDDIEDLDIEKIFALLEETLNSKSSLLIHILNPSISYKNNQWNKRFLTNNPNFHGSSGVNVDLKKEVFPLLQDFFEEVLELFKELKFHVLKTLRDFSPENSFSLYWSLFNNYPFANQPLVIFTTNYDLAIEQAFLNENYDIRSEWIKKGVKDFYLGFEPRARSFIFKLNENKLKQKEMVSVIKLHGSIDWKPQGNNIILADANIPLNPDTPYLIYPGYKGIPNKEPFLSLHFAFLEILSTAKNLITIGFAFRDSYINTIIHHTLNINKDLKVYVIAPYFPDDSLFPSLQEAFPKRVVHYPLKVVLDEDKAYLKNDKEIVENLFDLIEQ
ncbi:SIR2 family protein [Persephonella sp.]